MRSYCSTRPLSTRRSTCCTIRSAPPFGSSVNIVDKKQEEKWMTSRDEIIINCKMQLRTSLSITQLAAPRERYPRDQKRVFPHAASHPNSLDPPRFRRYHLCISPSPSPSLQLQPIQGPATTSLPRPPHLTSQWLRRPPLSPPPLR